MFESNCTMTCNDQMDRDFNKTFGGEKNATRGSNPMVMHLSGTYKEKNLNELCQYIKFTNFCNTRQ
uniref:Uncharacterized protein n=1 Tax=Romanomermis culicivorax TaxID=13658 RepID=A0A915IV15_ROMCU